MVSATAALPVEFLEVLKIKALDHGINNAYRVILRYMFGGVDLKKQQVVAVRFCM